MVLHVLTWVFSQQMPALFCESALKADTRIFRLVDESGRDWLCEITEDRADSQAYRMSAGWEDFRRSKCLVIGSPIMLKVTEPKSEVLYYFSS